MITSQRTRLLLEVSQPEAETNPVSRNPYQEGKSLPRNIEEDVTSHMLMTTYSPRQIRTINRREFDNNSQRSNARRQNRRSSRQSRHNNMMNGEDCY